MLRMKCSLNNQKCPDGLDICCQFCVLNYAPCVGKCAGCWDEAPKFDQMAEKSVTSVKDSPLTPVN